MPVTYTNRKGTAFTLFKVRTTAGMERYVMARQGKGEPVAGLPAGFHIQESPNGVVSLARDHPVAILPEETAVVQTVIARLARAKNYRVVVKPNQIEVYTAQGPDALEMYDELVAQGVALPGREAAMREFEERWTRFAPVMRFVLIDPERREFRVDERVIRDFEGSEWVWMGQRGELTALAITVVPWLAEKSLYGLPVFLYMTPPPAAVGPARTAATGARGKHAAAQPNSIHRLKVTLLGLRPPVWRRLLVPSDATLGQLHDIIQAAMGWTNSHLHQFSVGRTIYSDPRFGLEEDDRDERRARLSTVAPRAKDRLRYLYDFGDSWEHEILVEEILPADAATRYPICIAGKRACPPDDCGGVWGYVDFVEALRDPNHPEHETMTEWWGNRPFDPEAFDMDAVKRRLAALRR